MHLYALRSIAPVLRSYGVDPDTVFARVGLTEAELDDVDRRVPLRTQFDLLVAASEATGDPHFGLRWGAHEHPSSLGAVGYAMLHSPTVRDSLKCAVRYLHLVYEGLELRLSIDEQLARVEYRPQNPGVRDLRHDSEKAIASIVCLLELIAGDDWTPLEVRFTHARPADTSAYDAWNEAPKRFEAEYNAVVFPAELLDREIEGVDSLLLPVLRRHVEALAEDHAAQDDFTASVRTHVAELLPGTGASLESVAAALGSSPSAIRRRLKESGVSFRDIVETARRELSERYLVHTELPLTEVAYLLGYSEVSSFSRAFRRWRDTSPLDYRRSRSGV